MNSLFFLSICLIFDNIFHVRRGRCVISLARVPLRIFRGIAIHNDNDVRMKSNHHFNAHVNAITDIISDQINVPIRSIERGISICCIVLSI